MEDVKPSIGIVAGNLTQAMYYLREKMANHLFCIRQVGSMWFIDGRRYFIVTKMMDLRGVRNFTLEYTGLWYTRKDLEDIKMMEELERGRREPGREQHEEV